MPIDVPTGLALAGAFAIGILPACSCRCERELALLLGGDAPRTLLLERRRERRLAARALERPAVLRAPRHGLADRATLPIGGSVGVGDGELRLQGVPGIVYGRSRAVRERSQSCADQKIIRRRSEVDQKAVTSEGNQVAIRCQSDAKQLAIRWRSDVNQMQSSWQSGGNQMSIRCKAFGNRVAIGSGRVLGIGTQVANGVAHAVYLVLELIHLRSAGVLACHRHVIGSRGYQSSLVPY